MPLQLQAVSEADCVAVLRLGGVQRGELAAVGLDAFGNPLQFGEQFVIRDRQTGRALANVRYTIGTASGRSVSGVTNSMGRTQRVSTSGAENLTFHIEETA
ncbi:hypothetical protein BN2476_530057 [Paraburkholderia piptadeniae]|uniref:Uncharacterized protein n=1 Tax=Paraburkholderia piptadeniae TaxID=1701573 RepID=A0A1N7SHP8_9BURK|nr:hypothetical protein [Paraburkholderia piptadeniae]SIT46931.1 hypothetical protein BN2476_530057 [Paraburkholderia piptadeniae]